MSLQFILGGAGSGKSHYVFEKIIQESLAHPDRQYRILVPDQFTMQIQIEVARLHPRGGLLNIDVLSFNRLAHHIFREVGCQTPPVLEDMGKAFVLQRVAQAKKKELKVLGSQIDKNGCIQEIKSLVSELMQYEIRPDDLAEIQKGLAGQPLLEEKLGDIRILYDGFKEFLENHYVTSEEILELLCDVLPEAESMRNATVVLDGFIGFTPVQNRLLGVMLGCCRNVYVTVTLDGREDPYSRGGMHNRFWKSRKTMQDILMKARAAGASVEEPVRMETTPAYGKRPVKAPSLEFLNRHLFCFGPGCYEGEQDEIRILEASGPQKEMEETARRIRRLVREEGYHYRDIAVIAGDLEKYGWEAERAFARAEIPCFIDARHTALMNPMVECIRALWDMQISGFAYESVFRYLRCGLSELLEAEVDELENYCLALGIRGRKAWEQPFLRHSPHMDPARVPEMEALRKRFMAEIGPFTEAIRVSGRTVAVCCSALYEFLVSLSVQQKLEKRRLRFEAEGEAAMAREYAQIYRTVMDLLDKLVEILGEEKISLKDFRQLMETGLQGLRIGIIPPTADQVLVGDVVRTRLNRVRALFFVGVNEDSIPGKGGGSGILSEPDRDILEKMDVELTPTAREELYIQKFYLYLHLTKPSHLLTLSYSRSSASGNPIGPAYLIGVLQKLFPGVSVEAVREPEGGRGVWHKEDGLRLLIDGMRHMGKRPAPDWWRELLSWFIRREGWREEARRLLEAASYRKEQDRIGAAVAKALYGGVLQNSVSRIERYAACAYAHFLQYGLRLREREEYVFRPLDMGNILHGALERFARLAHERGFTFASVPPEELEKLLVEALRRTVEGYGGQILDSSSRSRYHVDRAAHILRRSIRALQEELADSDFEPVGFEVDFDHQAFLDGMVLRLSEEERMFLRGIIDRLDVCEDGNNLYVRVIDYKSGNTSFDFEAFYYGLQLQLVLYLRAAMELAGREHPDKQVEPAAILYYHMKDPLVEAANGQDAEIQRLKELRLNGLVASDENILKHLDRTLAPGKKSRLLPVEVNKNGELSARSQAVSRKRLEALTDYAVEKAARIGQEILEGHVEQNPYQRKDRTACSLCSCREACGFDERLPGCEFRKLEKMADEGIWEAVLRAADRKRE